MKKKVALVTGSNRGIGASCIEAFAKAGLNVVINYCHHKLSLRSGYTINGNAIFVRRAFHFLIACFYSE